MPLLSLPVSEEEMAVVGLCNPRVLCCNSVFHPLQFLVPVAIATAEPLEDDHIVDVSSLSDAESSDNDRDLPAVAESSLAPPTDASDETTTVLEDIATESLQFATAMDPSATIAAVTTEEAPVPELAVGASTEDAPSVSDTTCDDEAACQIGRGPEEDGEEVDGQGADFMPTPDDGELSQSLDIVTGGEGEIQSLELTGTQELNGTPPPSPPPDDVPAPEEEGRDKDDDDVPTFEEFKQQKMIEQEAAKRNNNGVCVCVCVRACVRVCVCACV